MSYFCCMVLRIYIGILISLLSIQASKAQLSKRDSIRLKQMLEGDEEIQINPEAVKSIQFNFAPQLEEKPKPRMAENKPWMDFDKSLPKNFNDTTRWRKPKFIRLLPYTVYTKWWEDPINDKLRLDKKDTLTFKLDLEYLKEKYMPVTRPVATFDTEKFLYENLTKRGRTIRRNRKRAKAWKIYNDYVPTQEDSIKWYGNKKRIPKDTLIIIKTDSLFHEDKINRQDKADKGGKVIPLQALPFEEHRSEYGKDN